MVNKEDSIDGFDDIDSSEELDLESLPRNWKGWKRDDKVQKIIDVVQHQLELVRYGDFDKADGVRVAALTLEAQMEISEFYADAEASARNAKHMADFIENEVALDYATNTVKNGGKKPNEAAISRFALIDEKVKEAKNKTIQLEKEHKKWRYIVEMLKEAHILFRNIDKLQ